MLDAHFNAYRYCYNLCLEYKSTMWKDYKINKTGFDMQAELFDIRKSVPWLSSCKAECLREAALQVERSYKNFFNGAGFPSFKSKKGKQSFTAHQNITIINERLRFYGHLINFKTSDLYAARLKENAIIKTIFSKDRAGDYFASCCIIADNIIPLDYNEKSVGVDLGIKDLAITSEGVVYPNQKYLINSQYKITKLQRRFAKSQKGGANRRRLQIKIAKVYRKSTRQRDHYYYQITNELIRDNQTIVLETLRVKNMMANHKLSRSIADVSWNRFTSILEYKAKWYGRSIIRINTFYPSSKMCSGCGSVKDALSLSERIYDCHECGLLIDRDINAAINIRNAGLKIPVVPMEDAVNRQANEIGSKSLIINN